MAMRSLLASRSFSSAVTRSVPTIGCWPTPRTRWAAGSTGCEIKDLVTGTLLPDVIENVDGGVAWADDNRTLLYVEKDPVTLLGPARACVTCSAAPARIRSIYEEPDESFDLTVERSKSERYLFIASESTTRRSGVMRAPTIRSSISKWCCRARKITSIRSIISTIVS